MKQQGGARKQKPTLFSPAICYPARGEIPQKRIRIIHPNKTAVGKPCDYHSVPVAYRDSNAASDLCGLPVVKGITASGNLAELMPEYLCADYGIRRYRFHPTRENQLINQRDREL